MNYDIKSNYGKCFIHACNDAVFHPGKFHTFFFQTLYEIFNLFLKLNQLSLLFN